MVYLLPEYMFNGHDDGKHAALLPNTIPIGMEIINKERTPLENGLRGGDATPLTPHLQMR